MKSLLAIAAVCAMASCAPDREPTADYEFLVDAQIINHGLGSGPVVDGGSYILSLTEGLSASKKTSAHAYWDTIYLVLAEEPTVGVQQTVKDVFRGGYRRGNGWAVDPDGEFEIVVTPVRLGESESEFKISGTVPLRMWWDADSEFREGNKPGRLGDVDVIWRPTYDSFEFTKASYVCRRAQTKPSEQAEDTDPPPSRS